MSDHFLNPTTETGNSALFTDDSISFYIQTFQDQDYAFRQALRLRSQYPGARIVVRSDGGGRALHRWEDFEIEFYNEERLFTISNGGKVVQRMLELHAYKNRHYLIKLDPDTLIARRLNYLPKKEGLFGTLQGPIASRSIQGGFIGITRTAALSILESKLLLDRRLEQPDSEDGPYMAHLRQRAERTGLTSFDTLLGWAASNLGLDMFDFPEVLCDWKLAPYNQELRWAMTHPDPQREKWTS